MKRTFPRKIALFLPKFVFALAACLALTASIHAQVRTLPGDWDGYYADGTKSTFVWHITRANGVLTFHDTGGSNTTFTGTRSGNTLTDSNGNTGTISSDANVISWKDGATWRRQGTAGAPPAGNVSAPPVEGVTPMEQACYDSVQGKIPWDTAGDTQWADANLRALCKGAQAARIRGICFKKQMPGIGWEAAIQQCSQSGSPGNSPTPPRIEIPAIPAGPARTITINNHAGNGITATVTYNTINNSGNQVPNTVSTPGTLLLAQSATLTIPRTNSRSPIVLQVKDYEGRLGPVNLAWDFNGDQCFNIGGTVDAPTMASCSGAVGDLTDSQVRQIEFKNQAAYDAGIKVTYYDSSQAGKPSPTPTTVQTGFLQTAMDRTVRIPAVTMPGQPISIELDSSATVKPTVYLASLPDNFPTNPVPCFSTSGTLFNPQGGPCSGSTANQPKVSIRTITFNNQAGFVASMTVSYTQVNAGGTTSPGSQSSGNLTVGASKSFQIPPTAPGTSISVSITGVSTMNNNFFSTAVDGGLSGDRCFKAWGTLFSPQGGPCN